MTVTDKYGREYGVGDLVFYACNTYDCLTIKVGLVDKIEVNDKGNLVVTVLASENNKPSRPAVHRIVKASGEDL